MCSATREYDGKTLTDEGFPALRVLALSPGVRPAHDHSVVPHAAQPAGLDHVADALAGLLGHDALDETLDALLLHQELESLRGTESLFTS